MTRHVPHLRPLTLPAPVPAIFSNPQRARYDRRAAEHVARIDAMLAREPKPGEEQPTCWVCGGRSADWKGHPACRGRRVA